MTIDFAAEGLLDGLEGGQRDARRELLEQLAADGVPIDELKAAVAEQRLALLPLERLLGGRYTAAEVAEQADVPVELWARFRRALGLPDPGPDEKVYGDEDIATAQSVKLWIDAGLPLASLLDITRVMGEGAARLAATVTAAFADAFLQPGDSERDVAQRFSALTEQLLPGLRPALSSAVNAHLRESIRRGMIGRAELEAGRVTDAQEMVVCFADIVGFTRLGGQLDVEELGTVAGRLAQLAAEVPQPPVRLVKTIGDAGMFVCPDPGAMVEVAAVARRGGRRRRPAGATGGDRQRAGADPGRRLLWTLGQPRQPGHRHRPTRQRARDRGGPRRGGGGLLVVIRRPAPAEGHQRARRPVSSSATGARRRRRRRGRRPREGATAGRTAQRRDPIRTEAGAEARRRGQPGLADREQIDDEDEGRVRSDGLRIVLGAVRHVRRDDQLAPATDVHSRYALRPALDDAARDT